MSKRTLSPNGYMSSCKSVILCQDATGATQMIMQSEAGAETTEQILQQPDGSSTKIVIKVIGNNVFVCNIISYLSNNIENVTFVILYLRRVCEIESSYF